MTPDEVDQRSTNRHAKSRTRLIVVALFTVACFLVLAGLLQHQQTELRIAQEQLAKVVWQQQVTIQADCKHIQYAAIRNNNTWTGLADIERNNPFIDKEILDARLAVYDKALVNVPVCPS